MLRQFVAAIVIVLLVGITAQAQAQSDFDGCYGTVNTDNVNMRAFPDAGTPVLGQWRDTDNSVRYGMEFQNEHITVYARHGEWLLIRGVLEGKEGGLPENWTFGWANESLIDLTEPQPTCELAEFQIGNPLYVNDPQGIVYVNPVGLAGVAATPRGGMPYTANITCDRHQIDAHMGDGSVIGIFVVDFDCQPVPEHCFQPGTGQQLLAQAQLPDGFVTVGMPNQCMGASLSVSIPLEGDARQTTFQLNGVPFETSDWTVETIETTMGGFRAIIPTNIVPPSGSLVEDPETACNGQQQGCEWVMLVDGEIYAAGEPLVYTESLGICAASATDVTYQSAGDDYPVIGIELWVGHCPGGDVIAVSWTREGHDYKLLFHSNVTYSAIPGEVVQDMWYSLFPVPQVFSPIN